MNRLHTTIHPEGEGNHLMYKIFHNHETDIITIGETRPEAARIQCLDLVTAQNTVRALNAVAAIADAVENIFATVIVKDAQPLVEWERELLETTHTDGLPPLVTEGGKLYLRAPGTKDFFDVHQNLADPAVEKTSLAPVDAAALATLREVLEGEDPQKIAAAARGLFEWTDALGLGQ